MSSPSVSLCMIVKNEEDFIDQCLKSVQHLVQEMIIIDTGSTDQTIEICKKYGAKIYSYPWNNHFADARNFGLSKAKGDWILWLDADEELEAGHEQSFLTTLLHSKASMLFMPVVNYYGETLPVQKDQAYLYYQPRCFRNHKGIQFYNRIHESPNIPENSDSSYTFENVEVPIHHYGYIQEITEKRNKAQRNLQLIKEEYQKPDHSPWIEYHLASDYYRTNDFQSALAYVNKSIVGFLQKGLLPPAILYRLKYVVLVETNSFDGAYLGIDKALLLYPDYVDLHFMKGLILFHKNEYKDALISFEKCLELGENHSDYLIMKGTGSFKAEHYKNLCLGKLVHPDS